MELNEKIKIRREELGLTLQDIADYLGVSKPTVQRYESGEIKNLKQETIEKLSQILKISPSYLMGWEDSESSKNVKKEINELIKKNGIQTIAAHFEGEEFTEKDKEDIENFINYVISKKKK